MFNARRFANNSYSHTMRIIDCIAVAVVKSRWRPGGRDHRPHDSVPIGRGRRGSWCPDRGPSRRL